MAIGKLLFSCVYNGEFQTLHTCDSKLGRQRETSVAILRGIPSQKANALTMKGSLSSEVPEQCELKDLGIYDNPAR